MMTLSVKVHCHALIPTFLRMSLFLLTSAKSSTSISNAFSLSLPWLQIKTRSRWWLKCWLNDYEGKYFGKLFFVRPVSKYVYWNDNLIKNVNNSIHHTYLYLIIGNFWISNDFLNKSKKSRKYSRLSIYCKVFLAK